MANNDRFKRMKTIKLQEWALFAEVLGGIAIVITLIFLVLETRANTNAIQVQTYQSLTAELNTVRFENMKTQNMVALFQYTKKPFNELTDHQKYRLIMITEATWGIYESAFYANERNVLGENEWGRFEAAICRNYHVDKTLWYPETAGPSSLDATALNGIARNVTPKFREYVESFCNN